MNKTMLVAALLWPFYAFTQDTLQPLSPKWDFGVRGGYTFAVYPNASTPSSGDAFISDEGLTAGVYATRYLSPRWSVRGEAGYNHIPYWNGTELKRLTLTLAPRFRVTDWLDLEAGVTANKPLNNGGVTPAGLPAVVPFLGAAVKVGPAEINLRYTAGIQPDSQFSRGGWASRFQLGVSWRLFRVKKQEAPAPQKQKVRAPH